MEVRSPDTKAASSTTTATPTDTPRMVSPERTRLARIVSTAIRSPSPSWNRRLAPPAGVPSAGPVIRT
jgi:hypothetical protein